MKIVITGSLGHISKPLAEQLLKKGHPVTVISSKPEKKNEIESLGATAAIGSIEDISFLSRTFTAADAVYTMLPPYPFRTDPNFEYKADKRTLQLPFQFLLRRQMVFTFTVVAPAFLFRQQAVSGCLIPSCRQTLSCWLRYARAGGGYLYGTRRGTGYCQNQILECTPLSCPAVSPWVYFLPAQN